MSGVRALVRGAQRLVPSADGISVLCYHLVGAGSGSPVDLPEAAFRAQLEWLRSRAAATRPWAEVQSQHAQGQPAAGAGESVVLTFDDAFENFYSVAYPMLRERGLRALLFVPVGFVEGTEASPLARAERLPPMTWAQLREVNESGVVEIGSHSWTHPDLRQLEAEALRRELVDSRDALQERLGVAVSTFCYPRALWSERVEASVGEAYRYAFVAGGGKLMPGRVERLRIPRVPIRSDMAGSLEPVLRGRIWLEEWIADRVRRYLVRSR